MPKAKPTPTPARKPARKKTAPPVDLNEVAKLVAANAKAIAELRKLNAETDAKADKRWREHDERMREHDKRMVQLGTTVKAIEKTNAETAKQLAQLGVRAAEADKRADKALAVAEKNNEYFGNHVRNEGELLEMQCYNTLKKSREINGIKLDDFHWGRKSAVYAVEVDIIGFNGKVVMPIEVKRTLSTRDVRRFAEVRVGRFKKAFPQYAAGKQTIPVIIFAMPRTGVDADGKPEDPVQLALDLGLTVLQSVGKNQLSPITDPDQVISRPHQDD